MRFCIFLVLCGVIWSCSGKDERVPVNVTAAGIGASYAVTATEDGLVTVLMQFGSADALAQRSLPAGQAVVVDSETVQPDSSSVGGVFYELQKPLADFLGNHVIAVTQGDKTVFADSFSVEPFFLPDTLLPQPLNQPMVLQLENFTDTIVRVLLVDTDFNSPDINATYPVAEGRVEVPAADLQRALVAGPAVLEVYQEREGVKGNRQMTYSYSARRDVMLVK